MRISDRVQAMQNSPIRKFNPMADAAEAAGVKIYHLNIGQPDIETPSVFWKQLKALTRRYWLTLVLGVCPNCRTLSLITSRDST